MHESVHVVGCNDEVHSACLDDDEGWVFTGAIHLNVGQGMGPEGACVIAGQRGTEGAKQSPQRFVPNRNGLDVIPSIQLFAEMVNGDALRTDVVCHVPPTSK